MSVSESSMKQNQHNADQNRDEDVKDRTGEEKQHDGENQHQNKNNTITDESSEDNNRFIAEEVEEEPRRHESNEDDERDWMPYKTEEENDKNHDSVVHLEVTDVCLHARDCVWETGREVE
ncbi:hypothetical protein KIW84_058087 [Lathyrus oleraceus]|uniref:Uncharacterized protein n=1 Tax=Pisum sativum TaxID=3888 RepID=A0A9D4X5G1_PEA|nr:hypothetical protein KIW84_058087 [Pisum sativum]